MSPRHEITHPDGTHEIVEGTPGGRVAVAATLGLTAFAIGSLAVPYIAAVLGGGGGSPAGIPETVEYSAPNTPTVTAILMSDTSGYANASAFGGSLDDSVEYTIFEIDSLRGDFSTAPLLVDTQTYAAGHVLRSDTIFTFAAADTFKVRAKHKGFASGLESGYSVVDTFVATYATGGTYDPYLPPAWTDTVHYEDFTGLSAASRFDASSDQTIGDFSVTAWGGVCTGARISGYSSDCRALDSVVFANQPSPPWVWEAYNPANSAGILLFDINFEDGNGPGAAANLTRVYVRYSVFFEENGTGIGGTDYQWSPDSNKYFNFNTMSNGFLNLWYSQSPEFRGQSSPDTETCTVGLTANTWEDYYPGDTVPPQLFGLDCMAMGIGGHGKRGIWQHHFVCMDFSPAAGSRVISYGMYSADEQGISAYHNNVTNYNLVGVRTDTDFDAWIWNGTYGGTKNGPAQSYWFDDLLIMTGSSGSCVTPPSFS